MKKIFVVSAVMLAMAACSSDDGSGSSDGFQCDVSRSDDTVRLLESYKGLIHEETVMVSLDASGQKKADIVQKVTYPDASVAQRMCAEKQDDAHDASQSYQVQCYGNTVESYFVERDDLDASEYRASFEARCAKMRKAAENGELDEM